MRRNRKSQDELAKKLLKILLLSQLLTQVLRPWFLYVILTVGEALSVVFVGENYFRYTKDFTHRKTPIMELAEYRRQMKTKP